MDVKISDPVAADAKRLRHLIMAIKCRRASLQSHRRVQHLEGGPHLVQAKRRPVEARVIVDIGEMVGVEIGKRYQAKNLAGFDIKHYAGAANGLEYLNLF